MEKSIAFLFTVLTLTLAEGGTDRQTKPIGIQPIPVHAHAPPTPILTSEESAESGSKSTETEGSTQKPLPNFHSYPRQVRQVQETHDVQHPATFQQSPPTSDATNITFQQSPPTSDATNITLQQSPLTSDARSQQTSLPVGQPQASTLRVTRQIQQTREAPNPFQQSYDAQKTLQQSPDVSTTFQHDSPSPATGNDRPQQSILPVQKPAESPTRETRDFPQTHDEVPAAFPQQVTPDSASTPAAYDINFSSGTGTEGQDKERQQNNDGRFCTKIHEAICGSNGRTYSNMCLFNQDRLTNSGLTVRKSGEC